MDNRDLAAWWDEAFNETVWWAAWRRALEDLTAEEAAWHPAPGRHSIWQIVNHMIHWREYFDYRVRGGAPYDEAELDRLNWQPTPEVNETAWMNTRERFASSHALVAELLNDPAMPEPPKPQLHPRYLLMHDNYHIGQVMFIRSLLGKAALES